MADQSKPKKADDKASKGGESVMDKNFKALVRRAIDKDRKLHEKLA